ncbi:uncharacterized protein DS421_11g328230 [Arachis hypogaea]|nr:uncharacterized protein DS421_11g328230 [Arachis hypogaea]
MMGDATAVEASNDPLAMKTMTAAASLGDSRTQTDGGDGGTAALLPRGALPLAQRLLHPDSDTTARQQ